MKRQYYLIAEAAELLRCSPRAAADLARANRIPLVKLAGKRDVLVPVEPLQRFLAGGVELEVVELGDGGRIVREKLNGAGSR